MDILDRTTTISPSVTTVSATNSSSSHIGHTVTVLCNIYALPILCFIGIIGNVSNLITLNSPKLRSVSYVYLRGLSVADLSCMIFVLIFTYFEAVKLLQFEYLYGTYRAVWYRAHVMLPSINISVSAGILIVVLLTIDRYICIALPIYFREWNVRTKAISLIFLAYMTALTLYLPMCWQMEAVSSGAFDGDTAFKLNDNSSKNFFKVVDNPTMLRNHYYRAYKWTRETLLKFIPIIVLAVLNFLIALAFRFYLLAVVAVMFFICNTPAAINLLLISEELKKSPGYLIFRALANFMEITNHALNFYVFCMCSEDYRKTFMATFPCINSISQRTSNAKNQLLTRYFTKKRDFRTGPNYTNVLSSKSNDTTSKSFSANQNGARYKNELFRNSADATSNVCFDASKRRTFSYDCIAEISENDQEPCRPVSIMTDDADQALNTDCHQWSKLTALQHCVELNTGPVVHTYIADGTGLLLYEQEPSDIL